MDTKARKGKIRHKKNLNVCNPVARCKRGNGPAFVGNFPGLYATPVKWASERI